MNTIVDPIVIAYIRDHPVSKRLALSSNVLTLYNNRVPIIIGRSETKRTPPIDKYRFLAPKDISFGKFIVELRRHILGINHNNALFFFIKENTIPVTSMDMESIYEKYKSDDGFLYISYCCENSFG